MCGIAGIVCLSSNLGNADYLDPMLDAISHRGPDGRGTYVEGRVALGHVRLGIIDLSSSADQPMHSHDGNLTIIFNGEIYNYKLLRNELDLKYDFKTCSDTEVILAAYQVWGDQFLSRLNGMFSFVLLDRNRNTLLCARDRFGIKPFYYCHTEDSFVFASEIKGILASDIVKPVLNEEVLYDFIVFNRTDHVAQTCFQDILNLRPGHKIVIDISNGKVSHDIWYSTPHPSDGDWNFDEAKSLLRKHLEESVALHLVSDVPVGSALSGGLDSSSIVSLMRAGLPSETPVHSFSAVYDDDWDRNEKPYIDACVTEKKLTPHFVRPNAELLIQDLDALILQQEEPFASASMFASWCVYREASLNRIKVLLNGQGADEVFGYDYMAAFYFRELLGQLKMKTLIREIWLFYRKQMKVGFTFKLFTFLCMPRFLRSRLIRLADNTVNTNYFKKYHKKSRFNEVFFSSATLNENVRNHLQMKLHHLLRVEDKNSMQFGVEGRVPYLEHNLVEFGLRVPAHFKVRNGEVKHILKEAMRDILPEVVYRRNNKIGYETPMDSWLREPGFVEIIGNMLASEHQPMASRLNITTIRKKWSDHITGKANNATVIWKYLYLTRWHQLYFN